MTLYKMPKSLKTRCKELFSKKQKVEGTYFSNGSQYTCFLDENCWECLNYRAIDTKEPLCVTEKDGTGYGCSITDLFELYQDNMTNDMRNMLIKDNKCPMKLTIEQAKIRGDLLLAKQNDLLKNENYNLRQGIMQTKLFDGGEL